MADPAVEVDAHSLANLRKLGDAYKAGDKPLQKQVRKSLQTSGEGLVREVIRAGSEEMPAGGGLRARLAAARGGVTVSLAGRNVSVSLRAKTREGYALRQINRGILRHPVFGEKRLKLTSEGELKSPWVQQKVPENTYSDAFNRGAPVVRARLRLAMQKALDDIAQEA